MLLRLVQTLCEQEVLQMNMLFKSGGGVVAELTAATVTRPPIGQSSSIVASGASPSTTSHRIARCCTPSMA